MLFVFLFIFLSRLINCFLFVFNFVIIFLVVICILGIFIGEELCLKILYKCEYLLLILFVKRVGILFLLKNKFKVFFVMFLLGYL